jgi:hypothetical protein
MYSDVLQHVTKSENQESKFKSAFEGQDKEEEGLSIVQPSIPTAPSTEYQRQRL